MCVSVCVRVCVRLLLVQVRAPCAGVCAASVCSLVSVRRAYHVCFIPCVRVFVCLFCMCLRVYRSARVCTTALWILGEYSISQHEIQAAIDVIKQAMGPTPFLNADGT